MLLKSNTPKSWDLPFQDSASPLMDTTIELHNYVMYYLNNTLAIDISTLHSSLYLENIILKVYICYILINGIILIIPLSINLLYNKFIWLNKNKKQVLLLLFIIISASFVIIKELGIIDIIHSYMDNIDGISGILDIINLSMNDNCGCGPEGISCCEMCMHSEIETIEDGESLKCCICGEPDPDTACKLCDCTFCESCL